MAEPIGALTFTLDLEDHRPSERHELRYPAVTARVLDLLARHGVTGTFFVVGEVARAAPDLVRNIAGAGHEIAYHSADHRPLTEKSAAELRSETTRDKAYLEDLTGAPVSGFRAPIFSLTPQSLWAVEVLAELGFAYSSSVLPARNPLYGYAGAPEGPFAWWNGLIELPAPVARFAIATLPYLGGVYFRYLPWSLIRRRLAAEDAGRCPWLYCHPYDFDDGEPFFRIKGASLPVSLLLWFNRAGAFAKLDRILSATRSQGPFAEQVRSGRFQALPVFAPQ